MKIDIKLSRCDWCLGDELYINYHDKQWGVPLHGDNKLFEMLSLEGAQAGLSWLTVLRKREGYRVAFEGFDIKKVSKFKAKKFNELVNNPNIIRNKLKILSVIKNAEAILNIQDEFGSFDKYIWGFVNFKPIQNKYTQLSDLPPLNDVAILMSKDLKKRGLNFVGPTICYAFMQATGMVNDHIRSCFRYKQLHTG